MQRQRFKNVQRLKDHPADTAKNFIVEGHRGTVSFITSMTEHFCAGCNRLRLLADGNFKVCLFGPAEVCYQFILCLSTGSNFYVSIFNGLHDIFSNLVCIQFSRFVSMLIFFQHLLRVFLQLNGNSILSSSLES